MQPSIDLSKRLERQFRPLKGLNCWLRQVHSTFESSVTGRFRCFGKCWSWDLPPDCANFAFLCFYSRWMSGLLQGSSEVYHAHFSSSDWGSESGISLGYCQLCLLFLLHMLSEHQVKIPNCCLSRCQLPTDGRKGWQAFLSLLYGLFFRSDWFPSYLWVFSSSAEHTE